MLRTSAIAPAKYRTSSAVFTASFDTGTFLLISSRICNGDDQLGARREFHGPLIRLDKKNGEALAMQIEFFGCIHGRYQYSPCPTHCPQSPQSSWLVSLSRLVQTYGWKRKYITKTKKQVITWVFSKETRLYHTPNPLKKSSLNERNGTCFWGAANVGIGVGVKVGVRASNVQRKHHRYPYSSTIPMSTVTTSKTSYTHMGIFAGGRIRLSRGWDLVIGE